MAYRQTHLTAVYRMYATTYTVLYRYYYTVYCLYIVLFVCAIMHNINYIVASIYIYTFMYITTISAI